MFKVAMYLAAFVSLIVPACGQSGPAITITNTEPGVRIEVEVNVTYPSANSAKRKGEVVVPPGLLESVPDLDMDVYCEAGLKVCEEGISLFPAFGGDTTAVYLTVPERSCSTLRYRVYDATMAVIATTRWLARGKSDVVLLPNREENSAVEIRAERRDDCLESSGGWSVIARMNSAGF